MLHGVTLIVFLTALGSCIQVAAAQIQPSARAGGEAGEADLRIEHHGARIRDAVTAAAHPPAGQAPKQPDTVWGEHRQLLEANLTVTSEELRNLLDSEDPATRALSAGLLSHISGRTVRESLKDTAAGDSAPEVRLAALDAFRTASGFIEICRLLRDFERRADLRASPSEIPKAQSLLEDAPIERSAGYDLPEPSSVQAAPATTPEAEKALAEELAEIWEIWGKEGTADEARKRLRNLGPAAIRPLTDRLWKDYVYGWYVAILMLPELGSMALIEPLSEIVRTHPERHMRIKSLEILLVANGFFEVWAFLSERIEAEQDPGVLDRAIAYRNACVAGPWTYEAEPAAEPSRPSEADLAAIRRLKEGIRDAVRAAANPAVGQPRKEPATVWQEQRQLLEENLATSSEELRELLGAEDPAIRALSAGLLGQIPGSEVRRALTSTATSDTAPTVRWAALDALRAASAFPEVCRLLRQYKPPDEIPGYSSYTDSIRRAQALLETSRVRMPVIDVPPVVADSQVAEETAAEAERIVAEVMEAVTDANSGEWRGIRHTLMRPLIFDEHRERIRNLGPAAVRPLTQRAWGENPYHWGIAKRLLWDLGGPALIEPLSEIVLTHPEAHVRIEAMKALLYGNGFFEVWDLLNQRIDGGIESEQDPKVRGRAIAYRNACVASD